MTGSNNNNKNGILVEATTGDDNVSVYNNSTEKAQRGLPPILGTRRRNIITAVLLLLLSLAGLALVRGGGSSTRSRGGDISVPSSTNTRTTTPIIEIKDQLSRPPRLLSKETTPGRRHSNLFTPRQQQQQQRTTKSGTFTVVERFPHDANAFTQGLQMVNATHYYESIGLYGKSAMRMVKLSTGVVVMETKIGSEWFGEGMCLYTTASGTGTGGGSSRLIQITWQEQDAFIYNSKTLKELGRMSFETSNGEGWGITFDTAKNVLYVSDGSSNLHTMNVPRSDSDTAIETTNQVQVYKKRRNRPRIAIQNLNELEYDATDGTVLANIWQQDTIVRINPRTGLVRKIYDMTSLYPRNERSATADVLNGIAKVPNGSANEFLITGKKWPWIYRVRFDE